MLLKQTIDYCRKAYDEPTHVFDEGKVDQQWVCYGNVIAFAGSNDFWDWLKNAEGGLTEWYGMQVRSGFAYIGERIRDQILEYCKTYDEENDEIVYDADDEFEEAKDEYDFIIFGHSLGGAMATLIGRMLTDYGYKVLVVTWGCPYVTPYPPNVKMPKMYHYHAEGDLVPHATRRFSFLYGWPFFIVKWHRLEGYTYLERAGKAGILGKAAACLILGWLGFKMLANMFKNYHLDDHYRSFICTDQSQNQ